LADRGFSQADGGFPRVMGDFPRVILAKGGDRGKRAESASIRAESLIMKIFTVIDGEKNISFLKETNYA
jgi:hypothetical protein